MSMLGTEISAEIGEIVDAVRNNHAHKWVTFKISDDRKVVIDQRGPPLQVASKEEDQKCFDKFVEEQFRQGEPRYAVYVFYVTIDIGIQKDILSFITWNPDGGNVRTMVMYRQSTNKAFLDAAYRSAPGYNHTLIAENRLDFDYNAMVAQIMASI